MNFLKASRNAILVKLVVSKFGLGVRQFVYGMGNPDTRFPAIRVKPGYRLVDLTKPIRLRLKVELPPLPSSHTESLTQTRPQDHTFIHCSAPHCDRTGHLVIDQVDPLRPKRFNNLANTTLDISSDLGTTEMQNRPSTGVCHDLDMALNDRSTDGSQVEETTNLPPTRIRMIGYWIDDDQPNLPDPAVHIDSDWDSNEQRIVAEYLNAGRPIRTGRGCSPCRICGAPNGFEEFTDGVFQWPEGLAHYVLDHGVRLPDEVIQHALRSTEPTTAVGSIDMKWWIVASE